MLPSAHLVLIAVQPLLQRSLRVLRMAFTMKDEKQHLRAAEKNRRTAKELHKASDLEAAFVEYAKAATLVLEKVPTHLDYHTLTNDQQRNLALVRLSI